MSEPMTDRVGGYGVPLPTILFAVILFLLDIDLIYPQILVVLIISVCINISMINSVYCILGVYLGASLIYAHYNITYYQLLIYLVRFLV